MNLPLHKSYQDIADACTYQQAEDIALFLMEQFRQGIYAKIEMISTAYHSAASQTAARSLFLPLAVASNAGWTALAWKSSKMEICINSIYVNLEQTAFL